VLAKRKANHEFYERNKERIKAAARARNTVHGDPERLATLRERFRIIGPRDRIPSDASIGTQNSCGRDRNERPDLAFILESRRHPPDGPWDCIAGFPDLSTFLTLGGKGQNRALKEFIRFEMLDRYADRYLSMDALPTESEVLRRKLGPPDRRVIEKRIRQAQIAQLTPDFLCPIEHCQYFGPMVPTEKGPYIAEKFLSPDSRKRLGVAPSDLLPGLYCPQCSALVLFPPKTDVGRPVGTGTEAEYRCKCGFIGVPAFDFATGEHTCSACGMVVSEEYATDPPSRHSGE
jgi:hypothetical protein